MFRTCYPTRPRPLFLNRISSFAQQASYFALTTTKLVKYNYAERKTFYLKILSPGSKRFLIFPLAFLFFDKNFSLCQLAKARCVRRAIIKCFLSPFNVFKLSELSTQFGTDRVMSLFA